MLFIYLYLVVGFGLCCLVDFVCDWLFLFGLVCVLLRLCYCLLRGFVFGWDFAVVWSWWLLGGFGFGGLLLGVAGYLILVVLLCGCFGILALCVACGACCLVIG